MKVKKNNIRKNDFWHSNTPLTSKRVRSILSNPVNSQKLVAAVRSARKVHKEQAQVTPRIAGKFKLS